MQMKKVLLIEDDKELQVLISDYLYEYGHICESYTLPLEAIEEFEANHHLYSIVILDLGLPGMDGFDLFKKIKTIKNIPIIISTARDDIGNKIYGFELGADDYLSKPYEPRELVLRIDATLNRYSIKEQIVLQNLLIDKGKKQVFLKGEEIEFTKIEHEIFFLLIEHPNKTLSREEIVNQTSLKEDTKNRTIDMHISNIRFKIDDDPKDSQYIKSVWGIGYKLLHDN